MLLAIDMGNTQIEVGLMKGDTLVLSERIRTDHYKTAFEYAVLLHNMFELHNVKESEIHGAILSSVVPPVTATLAGAVEKACGVRPMIVGPGVKTGLKIRIDDPKQLGADLVVAAVGGIAIYGAPLIIADLGTATTLSAINRDGDFLGTSILPGVRTSLDALVSGTSKLPKIDLLPPKKVIGTNTVDSMKSGIVFGQAAMLDGLFERMEEELGEKATLVATGGLASVIVPQCRKDVILDPELMIQGLKIIYDKNQKG